MITGTKIEAGKELTKSKKLGFFTRPKYIYIPLISGNDRDITTVVKKGDYIYKGSVVGKSKGAYRLPIHSSVSGTVLDFVQKKYIDGSLVKCIVIENDFKEKIEEKQVVRKNINDFSKEEFVKRLQDCGVVGMGGAGFPTYLKYNTSKKLKTLIVDAVECEPYITADVSLIKEKCEEILEVIDAIMEINGIKECFIGLKKDSNIINLFENYLGTYPKIKLVVVPNVYPMGWERYLVKFIKKVNYKLLPLEKGIVVNNIFTIYSIYEALKYNKPVIERIVTFTGEMLKQPQNVYVKAGTSVKDVIESIGGYKRNKDVVIIAGGPMMGLSIEDDDFIITASLNCVMAIKESKQESVLNCFRCGKCVSICPSKLSPVLIKDNLKKTEGLRDLRPDKCIECGLCSFVCPSKINIRGCVKEAKKRVMEERNDNK